MTQKKLPKRKYLRISQAQYKEWIIEIMSQEKFRFATVQDVAKEMERNYGGVESAHTNRMRSLRIIPQNFLPADVLEERKNL